MKSAAPDLFVNARTDTYWLGAATVADTLTRLDAYQQAGADGVFVPGLTDPARIAALVQAASTCPLNILYSPTGPTVAQLGDLGVRRVSLGSLLYRRALGAAVEAVTDIRAGGCRGCGTLVRRGGGARSRSATGFASTGPGRDQPTGTSVSVSVRRTPPTCVSAPEMPAGELAERRSRCVGRGSWRCGTEAGRRSRFPRRG